MLIWWYSRPSGVRRPSPPSFRGRGPTGRNPARSTETAAQCALETPDLKTAVPCGNHCGPGSSPEAVPTAWMSRSFPRSLTSGVKVAPGHLHLTTAFRRRVRTVLSAPTDTVPGSAAGMASQLPSPHTGGFSPFGAVVETAMLCLGTDACSLSLQEATVPVSVLCIYLLF